MFDSFESFSDTYHANNTPLWEKYAAGSIGSDFLKTERFRLTLFPESHSKEDIELCENINRIYLDTLCAGTRVVDNAIDTLKILSKSYLIGIISNGFMDTQYKKLYNTGLDRYVARLVISDEIDVRKPDPEIFHYTMAETGATPDRSIMVGDNLKTDIKGALDAGLDAVYFNPEGYFKDAEDMARLYSDSKLYCISSLRELPHLLR